MQDEIIGSGGRRYQTQVGKNNAGAE